MHKDNKLEKSSDRFLENKERKDFFANRVESLKKELSIIEREPAPSESIFFIIVEKLKEGGLLLPNKDLIDIRKKYINKSFYFIAQFNNNTFLMINDEEVVTGIGTEKYHMNNDEAKEYRDKYLPYMEKFVEIKKELDDNPSLLAKIRLEKMGI